MKRFIFSLITLFQLFFFTFGSQISQASPAFEMVALGVHGGLSDGNLSAYLVKPIDSENYVALDAGTLVQGLIKAFTNPPLTKNQTMNERRKASMSDILTHHIPAYLISHAHLDHIFGLVIAQPDLRNQQDIMARKETMQALEMHVFNWSVWGNFGNEGDIPQLNYQHYQTMPLLQWIPIRNTDMLVKAFPLNHGNGYPSTAFLLKSKDNYFLYVGDTGADEIEHAHNMKDVWDDISPLIRKKQLHAILLECSFTNAQPKTKLFGHLTPALYINELHQLANAVDSNNPQKALNGLKVFVTHVKPTINSINSNETGLSILQEIENENNMGIRFILPTQGEHYTL